MDKPHGDTPVGAVVGASGHDTSFALTLGSVGVVYGDIGTSPLYALREAVIAAQDGGPMTRAIVLGVLSMILWSLIIVVTLKYVLILLRADNNGEGGTLSLTALATRAIGRRTPLVFMLGVIGASMFLGDSVITPAISVLSAVEGLKLATPQLEHFVLPITVVILLALFAVQRRGTASVATFFGPVMATWFIVIAAAGLLHIRDDPSVLGAINPLYAIEFVRGHGHIGLVTLGLVFLAVTGGEALYADLGHFGRKPIQTAWLTLVLPALLINYFGQGAKVLADPAAIENPFYRMVPEQMLLPMIALATAATIIASQAVITGAYSLVRQAIQLGLLPRLAILHTSEAFAGQIYIPRVNTALLVGVVMLVLLFRTSGALASAYGIAVSTTMVMDGLLGFIVIWRLWRWPWWQAALLIIPLVAVDSVFLTANLLKLLEGAWVPLLFGISMVLLIITWRRGTTILAAKTRRAEVPLETLVHSLETQAAAHRSGHRRVPHQRSDLRPHRAPAQPQAQQGSARAERGPHHRDSRYPARDRGRAGRDHAGLAAFHPGRAQVRLYGDTQRPEGARDRAPAGLELRHHVDLVLPVAPRAQARHPLRHAALARSPLHRARQERQRCHRLLPYPDRARGRGRNADHGVIHLLRDPI